MDQRTLYEAPALPPLAIMMDLDGPQYRFESAWYWSAVVLGYLKEDEDHFCPSVEWEFFKAYNNMPVETFLAICNEAADKGLLWNLDLANLRDGAAAWRDLLAVGHQLHVKTDRSFGTHPIASEAATRIWLNETGRRYHSLTFTRDKTDGPECDIALEDKIENYDALEAAGVEVWLIDRGWNQDGGVRRRVFTHDEFVTRVGAMQRRRARCAAVDAEIQSVPVGG